MLPTSVCAPVRNPRVRWRSDVLEHPTPQTVSPPVVSSQNVPAATPSWSPALPVTRETPSVQEPVTPHVDVQPEFPPPASSADDDPMPLPHVDDTPPWVYQEPETPWIFTEEDAPATIPQQVPLPPYRLFRHGRRRTRPLVIQPFRLRLGLMKLHSRRQQFMKMFYHRPFRLTTFHLSQLRFQKPRRIHSWQSVGDLVRFIQFQKLRRFHLWQNVGDLAHFISRRLYRNVGDPIRCIPRLLFRPQRLHSFGGAPVFFVPCVHFEDFETQSDSSERVKRFRLAPAQVMSTALAKHCGWSLGFDERGPVFDGTQDWRGRAARKEVYFASESPENQRLLLAAMEREWRKWEEHKATLPLTQGELRMLKSRFPNLKIVGTRWVLMPKEPDFKARLVVQGCQ